MGCVDLTSRDGRNLIHTGKKSDLVPAAPEAKVSMGSSFVPMEFGFGLS